MWARQLNVESINEPMIQNHGGTMWIFGLKTEQADNVLEMTDGSTTEVLGGFIYHLEHDYPYSPKPPMFINNESSASLSYVENNYQPAYHYDVHMVETRDGVTVNLLRDDLPRRAGNGTAVPLYVGYKSPVAFDVVELAKYDFTGNTLTSTDVDPSTTASNFLNGSGYTSTSFAGGSVNRQVNGPGVAGNTALQNSNVGEYFSFTITPGTGRVLYLVDGRMRISRGSSSPSQMTVFAIPNGGPQSGQTIPVLVDAPVLSPQTWADVDLTGAAFQEILGVEIRIVFHGDNHQGKPSAYCRIDDVIIEGGAPAVFAPVTVASYSFSNSSLASSDPDPDTVSSDFANGSGYTNTSFAGGSVNRQVNGAGVSGNTAVQNGAAGEFFKFTVSPVGSNDLYLDSGKLKISRGQSSPQLLTVFAIPNGGPQHGQLLTVLSDHPVQSPQTWADLDFTQAAFQAINSAEIRVVFHGGHQGVSTAWNRVDDVSIIGGAQ